MCPRTSLKFGRTPTEYFGMTTLFSIFLVSLTFEFYNRRGSLESNTIQELMMYMCTWRLDLQEDHNILVNDYLTKEERQPALDERNIRQRSSIQLVMISIKVT